MASMKCLPNPRSHQRIWMTILPSHQATKCLNNKGLKKLKETEAHSARDSNISSRSIRAKRMSLSLMVNMSPSLECLQIAMISIA